jgi:hypothetical protein
MTMNPQYTSLKLMIAGALAATAFAIGIPSASAQTATSTATSTDASTAAAKPRKPRATATPEMIAEAIQRSKARTERLLATGKPEQFGSEEPFTFDPAR